MAIRPQRLETIAPVIASFSISQTSSIDDLKDADIGVAVTISANTTVSPCADGDLTVGKLIALTLSDADDGERVASVQICGICRLATATAFPLVGNRIVGAIGGAVKQAPILVGDDPAGGNIGRGTVLEVNGTTDCLVLLG